MVFWRREVDFCQLEGQTNPGGCVIVKKKVSFFGFVENSNNSCLVFDILFAQELSLVSIPRPGNMAHRLSLPRSSSGSLTASFGGAWPWSWWWLWRWTWTCDRGFSRWGMGDGWIGRCFLWIRRVWLFSFFESMIGELLDWVTLWMRKV